MSQWYYAEGNRQQQGPLPAETLVERYRAGAITLDTLVWRDGLAQWQPLAELAEELGLEAAEPPPADPHTPPPLPPFSVATRPEIPATPSSPRRGLSGCAIAAIIAGLALVVLLASIATLVAILLPKYQAHVLRSRVTTSLATMAPLKAQVADFDRREGRCPINGDPGFDSADRYARDPLGAIRVGRFDDGHCGLEAVLQSPGHPELDGKTIWLQRDPQSGAWQCSSEIADALLPPDCRG